MNVLARLLIACGFWFALGSTALAREAFPPPDAAPAQAARSRVDAAQALLGARAASAAWEPAAPVDEAEKGKSDEPAGDKLAVAASSKCCEFTGFALREPAAQVRELTSKAPRLVPNARAPPGVIH